VGLRGCGGRGRGGTCKGMHSEGDRGSVADIDGVPVADTGRIVVGGLEARGGEKLQASGCSLSGFHDLVLGTT
jgi:hypothetical protein